MDRVRTNATLFAEHSARIKRSYAALDTRVVSRFTRHTSPPLSLLFLPLLVLFLLSFVYFFSRGSSLPRRAVLARFLGPFPTIPRRSFGYSIFRRHFGSGSFSLLFQLRQVYALRYFPRF